MYVVPIVFALVRVVDRSPAFWVIDEIMVRLELLIRFTMVTPQYDICFVIAAGLVNINGLMTSSIDEVFVSIGIGVPVELLSIRTIVLPEVNIISIVAFTSSYIEILPSPLVS